MTARKDQSTLRGDRTPAFVDRATGAAELVISTETWDRWVSEGRLPPPDPGFPQSTPRWCWQDVQNKLRGKPQSAEDIVAAAQGLRNDGQEKRAKLRVA